LRPATPVVEFAFPNNEFILYKRNLVSQINAQIS
jgi:hypothetical protein